MADSDIRELKVVPIDIRAQEERKRLAERARRREEVAPQVVARAKVLLPKQMLNAVVVVGTLEKLVGDNPSDRQAVFSRLPPQQQEDLKLSMRLSAMANEIMEKLADEIIEAEDETFSGPLH